jgi:plasmid stabilization system protein ParE
MKRSYTVSLASDAAREMAEISAYYNQIDQDYGAGSNLRGRFLEVLASMNERLAENPRSFAPIQEYRFAVLSRSFRHVVLFRLNEEHRHVRILGIFAPGRDWRPKH